MGDAPLPPLGSGPSPNREPSRRGRYSRSDHRARSHDSAHAADGAGDDAGGRRADHPLVPKGPAALVTTDEGLRELIENLRAEGRFAYDSEFIGELTYFPKLCLVQAATPKGVWLIDPLAGVDLKPFWELLCDPAVEKVVHAGQQDIEPVIRHLNCEPANIFDTQVAAGFVGLPYPVSLSKLVMEMTGAKLGKGLTFTDWGQRPLSPMQLRYAADDVRYLPLVRHEIGLRLDALGHEAWAKEESAALCDGSVYRFDPETQYLRVRGANSLQPRNLAVLRELAAWRDAAARESDVPPRTFLKDEILLDLARSPVKSVDRLDRVRGLPRPVEHAHGREIVERTLRAMSIPVPELPAQRDVEQTPTERFRGDALWAAAQCLCAGRGIDAAVVTSRQEVGELFRRLSAGEDLSGLRLMKGWRREALGQRLVALHRGALTAELSWTDGNPRVDVREAGA